MTTVAPQTTPPVTTVPNCVMTGNLMNFSNFRVLEKAEKTFITWMCCITGPVTFLENVLVLTVICSSAHLRRRPSYLFIGSLAMADVLASCFFTVNFLDFHLGGQDESPVAYLSKLAGVTMAFTGSIGSLLLTAMDRYLCICQAQRYRTLLTQRRAIFMIAALWMVTIVISFLPPMGWRCRKNHRRSSLFPFIDLLYLGCWTSLLLLELVLILLAYALILWRAHQHEGAMASPQQRQTTLGRQQRLRTDIRLARTLGLILLILVVCWVPVFVFMIVDVFHILTKTQQRAFAFCSTMCLVNSAVNPLLYALRCRELRRALVSLTKRVRRFRPWKAQYRSEDRGHSDDKPENNNSTVVSESAERKQPDSGGETLRGQH